MTGAELLARWGVQAPDSFSPPDPDEGRRRAIMRLAELYGLDPVASDTQERLFGVRKRLQQEGKTGAEEEPTFWEDPLGMFRGAGAKVGRAATAVNERALAPTFEAIGELASGPERGAVTAPQIGLLAARLGGKNLQRLFGVEDEEARAHVGLTPRESLKPTRGEAALGAYASVPMELFGQTLLLDPASGIRRAAQGLTAGTVGIYDPEMGQQVREEIAAMNERSGGKRLAGAIGADEKAGEAFDAIAAILGPALVGGVAGARKAGKARATEAAAKGDAAAAAMEAMREPAKAEQPPGWSPATIEQADQLLGRAKQEQALASAFEQGPEVVPFERPAAPRTPPFAAADPFKMEKLPSKMSALELAQKGLLPQMRPDTFGSLLGGLGEMKFDPRAAELRAELVKRGAKGLNDAIEMLKTAGVEDPAGLASYAWTHGLAPGAQAAAASLVNPPQLSAPASKLLDALKGAKPRRDLQEQLYTQDMARRAEKLKGIEATGEAGYAERMAALKGDRPRVDFEGMRSKLSEGELHDLLEEVAQHPSVRGDIFLPARAQEALMAVIGPKELGMGRVPQPAQIQLLEKIFGPEFAEAVLKLDPKRNLSRELLGDVAGLSRAMMSALDLSAPLRQGVVLTLSRPDKSLPAFGSMLRSAFNEHVYESVKQDIASRPNAQLYKEARLHFIEPDLLSLDRAMRDEVYASGRRLEQLPHIGGIFRGLRKIRRPSERAYATFLNKLRADVFDSMFADFKRRGEATPENIQALGDYINTATGRGSLGAFESSAGAIATALFSPRLVASRLQTINPIRWARMPAAIRRHAIRDHILFLGTASAALMLAKMAGSEVQADARSSDFGKIKVGRTRMGVFGGFEQYFTFLARMLSGTKEHGLVKTARGGTRSVNRWELMGRFAESKFSPPLSAVRNLLAASGMFGESLEADKMIWESFSPMFANDAYEAIREDPVAGTALSAIALFGQGLSTYGENVPPELMIHTPAEDFIDNRMAEKVGKKERTETEREATARRHALEHAVRVKAPDAARQINEALDSGALSPQQAEALMKAAKLDPWDTRFKRLTLPEMEKAYSLARPGERVRWRVALEQKRIGNRADILDSYRRLKKNDGLGPGLDEAGARELATLKQKLSEMRRQAIAADRARRMTEESMDEAYAP